MDTNKIHQKNQPIGVFDSGIGGLSLLQIGRHELPNETWIYVADTAFLPYGAKPSEVIKDRAMKITSFLIRENVKAILVACNTATALSIDFLRKNFPDTIFIGVEPAVRPAVKLTRTKVVGILATEATTDSLRLSQLISRFGDGVQVIIQPCHGLVETIERGQLGDQASKKLLEKYVKPLLEQGVDTIALGCTHYSFVTNVIRGIAGESINLIDTCKPVLKELKEKLSSKKILATTSMRETKVWTTKTSSGTNNLIQKVCNNNVNVSQITI